MPSKERGPAKAPAPLKSLPTSNVTAGTPGAFPELVSPVNSCCDVPSFLLSLSLCGVCYDSCLPVAANGRAHKTNHSPLPLGRETDNSSPALETAKAVPGFSPAHFKWLRSTKFSTAGPARHGWEQLKNPQNFSGQTLSNIFNACSVLSPALAGGAGLWCSANVTTSPEVEVSKAALTLLRGTDSFPFPFTTSRGTANGDVHPGNHWFPPSTLSPRQPRMLPMEQVPVLFLAVQVEFVTGFWTPIPAGAGGKLALAWLTGAGKRIAHPVVAQAEPEPVLDFLELSEAMSQTSPRRQLAVLCQEPRSSCGLFRALGTALGKGRMWVNVWRGPRLWPAGTGTISK